MTSTNVTSTTVTSTPEPLLLGQTALATMRTVDLEGLVQHRQAAIDGLEEAISVMINLTGRGTLAAPTARQPEATANTAATATPHNEEPPAKGSSLTKALDGAGFAQRLGHVYISKRKPPFQPLKTVPDITGLPMFQACIAPSWSPIEGAHGIFITASKVITAVYPQPFENNRWHVRESHSYDNREEMLALVQQLILQH